jgi:hypothetical protein
MELGAEEQGQLGMWEPSEQLDRVLGANDIAILGHDRWGHGGPRNCNTSRKLQTWSVSPAAIAGVRGRYRRRPNFCRSVLTGQQKL